VKRFVLNLLYGLTCSPPTVVAADTPTKNRRQATGGPFCKGPATGKSPKLASDAVVSDKRHKNSGRRCGASVPAPLPRHFAGGSISSIEHTTRDFG